MKKFVVAFMLVGFVAATAFAADVVTYPSAKCNKGPVTFDHKAHSEKLACDKCHAGEPAKIEITKANAHKDACKNCHKAMKPAPTKCGGCHKK